MGKKSGIRYTITGILFTVIFVLLAARLFNLQFVNGETYQQYAQEFSQKKIRLTGARGKILDSKGLPLAYNKTNYSVQFVRNPSLRSEDDRRRYTQSIIGAMKIIEENGGEFLQDFAIRKTKAGSFDFFWPGVEKGTREYDDRVKEWKNRNCTSSSAERPILSKGTPEQIFNQCLEHYYIPAGTSYEDAFKVLSVWQQVTATLYSSYIPITLAENVDMNTVAKIRIKANELIGMQISQSSSRVYPNKSMAAHIVGYMRRMSDEPTIKAMKALGYDGDDLIGVAGVEKTEEPELSGNTSERTGTRVVEVDNHGKVVREISSDNKSPKPGNNVMLTLDSGLQKITEAALAENIAQTRAQQQTKYQSDQAKYDKAVQDRGGRPIQYAAVGAAVVMNVQTGEVLAMASYPSYDPNIFTGGSLSQEDYDKYFGPGTNNPLFNNAISSRGTPGSIFKMCTGVAGLMEGVIGLQSKISDDAKGYVKYYTKNPKDAPKCWVSPYKIATHADQTIIEGLKNSCNFFFYTVADGLGVNRLYNWADKLGLTTKTNIELPNEIAGQVGSQATLYSPGNMSGVAALVRNYIVAKTKAACKKANLNYSDETYTATALKIMDLVNQDIENPGPDIRAILRNDLKLDSSQILAVDPQTGTNLSTDISNTLTEIVWTPNMTIEAGIGQSVTMLTPISVARYVSAIVNGGELFDARLVKSVITPEGDVRENPPKLVRNLNIPLEYLDAIKAGMHGVVSDEEGGTAGTAASYFKDFEYMPQIGGKTGTAQVNETIDLENNSWFVAFVPFDKPEIAVVVYIPNGYQGALSSYTVKKVIQYYMDSKKIMNTAEPIPLVYSLVK